jgi:hypothetical protein
MEKYFHGRVVALPTTGNGFLWAGDGVTCFYKLILELIQKNGIPQKVVSDCVVWWRGGYAGGLR